MRYKPQPKGEIDSQIFSFCLTDKILGSAARFDGSLQNGNTGTLQGWQRSLSFFLYLAKVVMTLGSRNASLCPTLLRDDTAEWKRALPSSLPVDVARRILPK